MSNPTDLKYTRNHEWIRNEGEGTATIGITDFAQSELGDVVFVELEQPGFEFEEGEEFGTIEAVKNVSGLYAPVSGKINEINEQLEEQPELVNDDPYIDGWMIKISLNDDSELDNLMDAAAYDEVIA